MRLDKQWKFHGNINRILEMSKGGLGVHAIAGCFKDNNININATDVEKIIKIVPVLTQKALPKAKATQLIQNNLIGDFVTA